MWINLSLLVVTLLFVGWLGLSFRRQPKPEQQLSRAQELARSGRFQDADVILRSLSPGESPAESLLRAQVAGALERTDDALLELAKIADNDPLGPLARLSEGQLEARRGRLRHAEKAFRATLRLLPDCIQAHRELVYILSIQQRIDEIDEPLTALSALGSLDLKHLIHWGMVRSSQWSASGDLPALRRYVEADPGDLHSRLALIKGMIQLGRLDDASEQLSRVPDSDAEGIALRSELAEARNDLSGADRLLATGPERHFTLARLRGRRALSQRNAGSAIRWFSIAREFRPDDRTSAFGLASALSMIGRKSEAVPLLNRVRFLDDVGTLLARAESAQGAVDAGLARDIGLACHDAGRHEESRAWLKHAIALDPSDSRARKLFRWRCRENGPVETRREVERMNASFARRRFEPETRRRAAISPRARWTGRG